MTHIYTLITAGYLQPIGNFYEVTNQIAMMWAARKRVLTAKKADIEKQLEEITYE
jgi:hypothetical protein